MKVLKIIEWLMVAVVSGPILLLLVVGLALLSLALAILPGGTEIIQIESDRATKWISKSWRFLCHCFSSPPNVS